MSRLKEFFHGQKQTSPQPITIEPATGLKKKLVQIACSARLKKNNFSSDDFNLVAKNLITLTGGIQAEGIQWGSFSEDFKGNDTLTYTKDFYLKYDKNKKETSIMMSSPNFDEITGKSYSSNRYLLEYKSETPTLKISTPEPFIAIVFHKRHRPYFGNNDTATRYTHTYTPQDSKKAQVFCKQIFDSYKATKNK